MSPSPQGPAVIFARSRKNALFRVFFCGTHSRKNSQCRVRKIEPAGAQNRKSVRASSVSGPSRISTSARQQLPLSGCTESSIKFEPRSCWLLMAPAPYPAHSTAQQGHWMVRLLMNLHNVGKFSRPELNFWHLCCMCR